MGLKWYALRADMSPHDMNSAVYGPRRICLSTVRLRMCNERNKTTMLALRLTSVLRRKRAGGRLPHSGGGQPQLLDGGPQLAGDLQGHRHVRHPLSLVLVVPHQLAGDADAPGELGLRQPTAEPDLADAVDHAGNGTASSPT